MKTNSLGAILLLLILVLLPKESQSYFCYPSNTDSIQLSEVRINKKTRQKDLQSTAPRQTISIDEMEKMGNRDLSDAMRHMAGVTLRDYGGAGGLKTISIRGLGAQFTGVNYDGVALSDIQTGQIDLSRYTLNGISQIGLQIGDGSDIFQAARNSALPSLLEIQTIAPSSGNNLHLGAQTTLGAWGYTSPSLRIEKGLGPLALSFQGDYIYAENDYPFTIYNISERIHKHRVHSLMNQAHAELGASYRVGEKHFLSLKSYYYDNKRQLPGIVRYYTDESKQELTERNAFTQLNYRGQLNNKWAFKGAAKWNWASSDYSNRLYQNGHDDAQYWQREGYLTAAALWRPTDGLALSGASDFIYNSLNSHALTIVNSRPTRKSYLNTLSLRWNHKFLTLSGRLLHTLYFNKTHTGPSGQNYRRLTPSASAAIRLADGVMVRMMWKKIFRAPSFNDLYYYHLGQSTLRPERTTQWNAGLTFERSISRHIQIDATIDGYINKVKDKIVAVPYNLFVWSNINAQKVDIKGLDLTTNTSWNIKKNHQLWLRSHYSFQHAVDCSAPSSKSYKKQLPYMPRHTFSLVLGWDNPLLSLSLDATGQSQRWANANHAQGTDCPGYAELGATASKKIQLKNNQTLKATLTLSNLLNKQYEIIAHYPMPGRGWRLTIGYAF